MPRHLVERLCGAVPSRLMPRPDYINSGYKRIKPMLRKADYGPPIRWDRIYAIDHELLIKRLRLISREGFEERRNGVFSMRFTPSSGWGSGFGRIVETPNSRRAVAVAYLYDALGTFKQGNGGTGMVADNLSNEQMDALITWVTGAEPCISR